MENSGYPRDVLEGIGQLLDDWYQREESLRMDAALALDSGVCHRCPAPGAGPGARLDSSRVVEVTAAELERCREQLEHLLNAYERERGAIYTRAGLSYTGPAA